MDPMESSSVVSNKTGFSKESTAKIPIMKDGMATCLRCSNVGVKDTFYGKGKQYCSANCVRGLPPASASRSVPLFKIPPVNSANLLFPSPLNQPSVRKVNINSTPISISTIAATTISSSVSTTATAKITTNPGATTTSATQLSLTELTASDPSTETNCSKSSSSLAHPSSKIVIVKSSEPLLSITLSSPNSSIPSQTTTESLTNTSNAQAAETSSSKAIDSLSSVTQSGKIQQNHSQPSQDKQKQQQQKQFKPQVNHSNNQSNGNHQEEQQKQLQIQKQKQLQQASQSGHKLLRKQKTEQPKVQYKSTCTSNANNCNDKRPDQHNQEQNKNSSNTITNNNNNNNNITPKSNHTNSSSPLKNASKNLINSFNWLTLLDKDKDLLSAPVSSFKHCPLSDIWNNFVTIGLKVEVKNRDIPLPKASKTKQDFYWIASVVKVTGYFILLRYEGFDADSSKDFWINLFTNQVHSIGWCAAQNKILIPPRTIADKFSDWKAVLVKRLTGARTLPENFFDQLKESLKTRFKIGMKLECIDKHRISSVRVATIDKIIGGRLHLKYDGIEGDDASFWCHQNSSLIHPVGWAQVVGHELVATQEYARLSLEKAIDKKFDETDANWSLFSLQRPNPAINSESRFAEGMKLEAIDPLNLSTICVATVTKVLRNHYLMVGIDGGLPGDGSDWFCYHTSSPNIFPVGFCMLNNILLTPPKGYPKDFSWFEYLQETQSRAAPVHLFKKDIPAHGFKEGMYLEAVDLMVPRLICVATITKVVGRLLRIHFNGWDESYDQWCDCESPELYPIGWCQMVGYPLEPPNSGDSTLLTTYSPSIDGRHKKRNNNYKGRHKRRRRGAMSSSHDINTSSSSSTNVNLNSTNTTSHHVSFPASPDKASTSDYMNTSFSSLSDWTSFQQQPELSLSPISYANESNSSVIVKPSPVQLAVVQESPVTTTTSSASSPASSLVVNNFGKLSDNPHQWSVADVCHFLKSNDCGSYCQNFLNEKIDGSQLLKLTRDGVLELTDKKLGPSLKIYALIQSLRRNKNH